MKIMLDTNIYDSLLNDPMKANLIKEKYDLYITHIQIDEIEKMSDKKLDKKILY